MILITGVDGLHFVFTCNKSKKIKRNQILAGDCERNTGNIKRYTSNILCQDWNSNQM